MLGKQLSAAQPSSACWQRLVEAERGFCGGMLSMKVVMRADAWVLMLQQECRLFLS